MTSHVKKSYSESSIAGRRRAAGAALILSFALTACDVGVGNIKYYNRVQAGAFGLQDVEVSPKRETSQQFLSAARHRHRIKVTRQGRGGVLRPGMRVKLGIERLDSAGAATGPRTEKEFIFGVNQIPTIEDGNPEGFVITMTEGAVWEITGVSDQRPSYRIEALKICAPYGVQFPVNARIEIKCKPIPEDPQPPSELAGCDRGTCAGLKMSGESPATDHALEQLTDYCLSRPIEPCLRAFQSSLKQEDAPVKAYVEALKNIGAVNAEPLILDLMNSRDGKVPRSLIDAVAQRGDAESTYLLYLAVYRDTPAAQFLAEILGDSRRSGGLKAQAGLKLFDELEPIRSATDPEWIEIHRAQRHAALESRCRAAAALKKLKDNPTKVEFPTPLTQNSEKILAARAWGGRYIHFSSPGGSPLLIAIKNRDLNRAMALLQSKEQPRREDSSRRHYGGANGSRTVYGGGATNSGGDPGHHSDPVEQIRRMTGEVDENGNTALHLAAALGHRDLVTRLLEVDPRLSVRPNSRGWKPAEMAIANGNGVLGSFIRQREDEITLSPPADRSYMVSGQHMALGGREPASGQTVREGQMAIALDRDRVLVAGGPNDELGRLAQIWSFEQGASLPIRQMPFGHFLGKFAKMSNGRIMIVGGRGKANDNSIAAEIFDPPLRAWQHFNVFNMSPDVNGETFDAAITPLILRNGTILIAHNDASRNKKSADLDSQLSVFEPSIGEKHAIGRLARLRKDYDMVELLDGRILVWGGMINRERTPNGKWERAIENEIFDPATGLSVSGGKAPDTAKPTDFMMILGDGRVLAQDLEGWSLWDPKTTASTRTLMAHQPTQRPVEYETNKLAMVTGNDEVSLFDLSGRSIVRTETLRLPAGSEGALAVLDSSRLAIFASTAVSCRLLGTYVYPVHVIDLAKKKTYPVYKECDRDGGGLKLGRETKVTE